MQFWARYRMLPGDEALAGEAGWLELIEAFRALGGVAENVRLGTGEHGRGLFPCDASRPARIHVPENLLLPVEDVAFVDGRLCVAPSSSMGPAERKWFEHYANAYTWGGGGRAETENFLAECFALPDRIRDTLFTSFGMSFCSPERSPLLVQEQFLDSRVIAYNGKRVVMPMVELVNHGDGASGYDCTNGVAVEGTFDTEVVVNYRGRDSFGFFSVWGFAVEVVTAMSLPISVRTNAGEISVKREFDRHHVVNLPGGGEVLVPAVAAGEQGIELSFLMLGAKGFPRLPKGIFHRVFREAGKTLTDEPFELIQFGNRQRFLSLLRDLEGVEGIMAGRLRAMCLFQLDALSHCYGTRTI